MSRPISQSKALRKMYLAIFLRGRAARNAGKESAPTSIGKKLATTLALYTLFGCFALFFMKQSVLALSIYLHASTLMFTGMFVAGSAGEALFNKEEGDILMHRPIEPRTLLWAKTSVIVQVALWLAGAFNLVGLVVGAMKADGGWMFPVAHIFSTAMQALFCVGAVVLTYQLCMRWFGRERLDNLITAVQTAMSVLLVLGSQLAPRFMPQIGSHAPEAAKAWWFYVLPPVWFAGIDDALAGSGARSSWILGGIGIAVTALILRAGFGTLARDYGTGLQTMQESAPASKDRGARRPWFERLLRTAPFRWWLKDSVARAAFVLSASYMMRDRDVKLRLFPGLAPILIMPIIFLMPQPGRHGNESIGEFGLAFAGMYLGLLPMMGLSLLKYSQQWQASEIFRTAPVVGPGALCDGARKAMMCLVTFPLLLLLAGVTYFVGTNANSIAMLLPGLIALPVFAMVPCMNGEAVPLSQPAEEAKQAGRGLQMIGVMIVALAVAAVANIAKYLGAFWIFLIVETLVAAVAFDWMRKRCSRRQWAPLP
jgi:hypothetical protein